MKKKPFIGFWNYTVYLTYVGLISAIIGIIEAAKGKIGFALGCLCFTAVCDTFDGKIARSKKDRTDDEKLFGVQIDSLCDVVSFGIFPPVFFYGLGIDSTIGVVVLAFYGTCAVVRLAYYNVLETSKMAKPVAGPSVYMGLPVTTIALFAPIFYLCMLVLPPLTAEIVVTVGLFMVAVLFILNFKVKKPTNGQLAIIAVVMAAILGAIIKIKLS